MKIVYIGDFWVVRPLRAFNFAFVSPELDINCISRSSVQAIQLNFQDHSLRGK